MDTDTTPAIWEMVVVHRVFRRELALAPRLVRAAAPGDTERAVTLAAHLAELLDDLCRHQEAEDELLWPPLLDRAPAQAGLVDGMERQHERIAAHAAAVLEALPGWAAEASAADRNRIAGLLARLREDLLAHLDQEEERILPLVADHLTAAEWDALGEHARSRAPRRRRLIRLGAVLEDATPWEAEAYLRLVPRPARALWTLAGRARYRRHIARVRGRHGIVRALPTG